MNKIKEAYSNFQNIMHSLSGIALSVFMVIIIIEIFTRYVVFHSLPWSEELSRYVFIFMLMMSLNLCISSKMLIKIDAIDTLVKGFPGKILIAVREFIGLFVCTGIAIFCTNLFRVGMIQKSPAIRLPMIIMYSIVFFGFCLSSISAFFCFIESVIDLLHKNEKIESGRK